MSVVLFPSPFYFVFYISNLISYIQNNFKLRARSPHNGNHFSSINACRSIEIDAFITPHAQRERGKVIGRGVHLYYILYLISRVRVEYG